MKELLTLLVSLRESQGISQSAFAKKLCWSQSRVSKLESGHSRTRLKDIIKMFEALGCEVSLTVTDAAEQRHVLLTKALAPVRALC